MKKIRAFLIISIISLIISGSASVPISASGEKTATGYLDKVSCKIDEDSEAVFLSLKNYTGYNAMTLYDSGKKRIVIDIFNAQAPGKQQLIQTGGKYIVNVRYAQFDSYTARVVLEVNGEPEYGVTKTTDGLTVYIGNIPETSGTAAGDPSLEFSNKGAVKKNLLVDKNFKIAYTPVNGRDDVSILLPAYKGYKVSRLTGPDRLVIDIPNVKYGSGTKSISTKSGIVKAVRYSKQGTRSARIVLDMAGQLQYNVTEDKGKLTLSIVQPEYRNILYSNNEDRVFFQLHGAKLTSGEQELKKLYTGSYDPTGKKYMISFPSAQADLGSGTFKIYDGYVRSMEISSDTKSGTTCMTFSSDSKLSYMVYTRGTGDTYITALRPAAAKEKIVVIDAGHGGSAPGTIYGDTVEKEVNLDIALKLNALLGVKGVKTYMLRSSDIDVDNFERAYIANMLKASLYISIHNNSLEDRSVSGTMTLYCPSKSTGSLNGKDFAEIIQQKLVGALKTVDRKTVERPNLIVLKNTVMPSAIAEIAFISNTGDRNNLGKASFRQNAAQALCDAVVKALSKVK